MNRIKAILFAVLIIGLIPLAVNASSMWTGNGVYKEELSGSNWGVKADEIVKVYNPGRV